MEILFPLATDRFTPLVTFIRFKRQYTVYKYYCQVQGYYRYFIRDNRASKTVNITVSLSRFIINKYNS